MKTKAPEVIVKIADADIETDLGCCCSKLEVQLDMDDESYAIIEADQAYDIEARSLSGKVSAALLLGSKVEITMGYAGDKKKVFAGYLGGIELESGPAASGLLRLYAYDAVHLMKENIGSRIFKLKRHSDVVTQLIAAYSWTGLTASCDRTDPYEKARCWYQTESDYDFIRQQLIAGCPNDHEFYLSLGVAYYKKARAAQPVVTLEHQENFSGIRACRQFLNKTMQVYGASAAFQSFKATADAAGENLDSNAGAGIETIVNPDADSQDIVAALAANAASRYQRQAVSAELELDGNYLLLSGAYVKIIKLDPIYNGTYRIRKAQHTFDEHGYMTKITVEGT